MILCPKCGFEQPEDMYCAKCGVNISTYKGRAFGPRPIILLSTLAAVLTLGWLATKFSTGLSQFDQKFASQEQALDEYERGTTAPSSTPNNGEVKSAPLLNLTKKEIPKNAEAQPSINFASVEITPEPLQAALSNPQQTQPSQQSESKITNQLTIQFYLVSKDSVEKLRLVLGGLSSSSISKAMYNEIIKDSNSQTMGAENHNLVINQQQSYSQGAQEPKAKGFIGFVIDVTAMRISDTQGDYKINVKRSLPEVTPQGELTVVTADFQENISISAGQVTAISGLLPRKNLLENEDTLYRGNILRALIDPEFQKFEQEFVLFFVP